MNKKIICSLLLSISVMSCALIVNEIPAYCSSVKVNFEVEKADVAKLNYRIYMNDEVYHEPVLFDLVNIDTGEVIELKSEGSYLRKKGVPFGNYELKVKDVLSRTVHPINIDEEYILEQHIVKRIDLFASGNNTDSPSEPDEEIEDKPVVDDKPTEDSNKFEQIFEGLLPNTGKESYLLCMAIPLLLIGFLLVNNKKNERVN